jgi:hypothetical protein
MRGSRYAWIGLIAGLAACSAEDKDPTVVADSSVAADAVVFAPSDVQPVADGVGADLSDRVS